MTTRDSCVRWFLIQYAVYLQTLSSFTSYLGTGDKGRLSNLRKAIMFLNDQSDIVNEFGTYVVSISAAVLLFVLLFLCSGVL